VKGDQSDQSLPSIPPGKSVPASIAVTGMVGSISASYFSWNSAIVTLRSALTCSAMT